MNYTVCLHCRQYQIMLMLKRNYIFYTQGFLVSIFTNLLIGLTEKCLHICFSKQIKSIKQNYVFKIRERNWMGSE